MYTVELKPTCFERLPSR